ncbi:MAG TPA: DUF3592 domain-containing protein [Terriglobales bacterium]|nr:DUF3592 domain-containing protein [Terriglobales bacterium]
MNARAVVRVVLLWIGLVLLFAAIAAGRNFFTYRQLATRGVEVTGEVTRLEQSNHHVTYSYAASGRMLSGRGNVVFGNPEFQSLHIGDPVSVTYLPDNDTVSCLGDAKECMRHRARLILNVAVVFPALILFFSYQKYPGFRAWVKS